MKQGDILAHYRVIAPLGAGGMGEVYAAEDTKLHRRVALKRIPVALAGDPERRKRFEREARAVAALNHPGIVTIYSVEEDQGVPFLTMELVEGQPLKETIPAGGATLDTLLRAGLAMSEALAFAHQRGIVHRDLKPANVMVTKEGGRLKILDFGLAKLFDVEASGAGDASTKMVADDLTGEGRIVGTVAYMSPEQAEGKSTDHRSDIFSLGVILHEMATGERPFKGDTSISLISSILKDAPPAVTDTRPDLPEAFTRIVRRCLAKDPLRRYQSAQDLHNDLDELKQDVTSGVRVAPVSPRRSKRPWYIAAAAVVVVAALAAGAWFLLGRRQPPAQVFVPDRFSRLTDSGSAFMAELSRDGRYVVHVKLENRQPTLWVRQTATTSDVKIATLTDVQLDGMTFSNDGTFVYYVGYAGGSGVASLFKVPALGGTPLKILEDTDAPPSFSPDGARFSFIRGVMSKGVVYLMTANADGSDVRELAASQMPNEFARETAPWSPDGKTIVVREASRAPASRMELQAVTVATGTRAAFSGDWNYISDVDWMPDGRSLIVSGIARGDSQQQLWQVTYPGGERQKITRGIDEYRGVSIGDGGRMIATVEHQVHSNIWVYPLSGGGQPRQVTSVARGVAGNGGLAWTPDGRVLYAMVGEDSPSQLWVVNADGSGASPLIAATGATAWPAASADGKWIYYSGMQNGQSSIFRVPLTGGEPQRITPGPSDSRPQPSPDGKWVYFTTSGDDGRNRAMKTPADGSGSPVALTPPEARFWGYMLSPDGAQLSGPAWNQARRRTQAAFVSTADGSFQFRDDVPQRAQWLADGKTWLYPEERDAPGLYVRPIAGGSPRKVADLGNDQPWHFAASPDGKLVAVARGQSTSDVVLIRAK